MGPRSGTASLTSRSTVVSSIARSINVSPTMTGHLSMRPAHLSFCFPFHSTATVSGRHKVIRMEFRQDTCPNVSRFLNATCEGDVCGVAAQQHYVAWLAGYM